MTNVNVRFAGAGERGSALAIVMLTMILCSAIAIGAAAVVRIEILVAAHYRRGGEARFAAEAAAAAVVADLRTMATWTPAVSGARQSGLSQGAFAGSRSIPGGSVSLCCGPGSLSDRLAAETATSPVPARRTIRWRPFLWCTLDALAPRSPPGGLFVVAWIGNDESDPAGGGFADTNDTVIVRAEAIGAGGTRRMVEVLVARQPEGGGLYSGRLLTEEERRMRVVFLQWREIR